MRDDEVPDAVYRAERDLIELKSSQRIAADSWKIYRYVGSFVPAANTQHYLIFTTTNSSLATVKLDQVSWTYEMYPTGVIHNNNSIYFWAFPIIPFPDPAYPLRYGVSSTQRGTVSITTTPPS